MMNTIYSPENRVSRLKRLINSKNIVRILESHNALTGLIIDKINILKNKKNIEFDGMWSSIQQTLQLKVFRIIPHYHFSPYFSLQDMMDATTNHWFLMLIMEVKLNICHS